MFGIKEEISNCLKLNVVISFIGIYWEFVIVFVRGRLIRIVLGK